MDVGLGNALEDVGENRAAKHTILMDGRGMENTLEDEGKNRARKHTILIDGRKSSTSFTKR